MKKKMVSLILVVTLCLCAMPLGAFASAAGLCEHHTEHIDCGYVEGASPCDYTCDQCAAAQTGEAQPGEVLADPVALLSATEGTSGVYAGGVQLAVNKKYVTDANGVLSDSQDGQYNVLLTEANGMLTLTLNGATITGNTVAETAAGIYDRRDKTLEIVLIGKNQVTAVYDQENSSYAIQSNGSLIISNGRDGELIARAQDAGGSQPGSYGIHVLKDLTITGGTVTAIAGNAPHKGYAIYFGGNLTISGGRVLANCYIADDNAIHPVEGTMVANGPSYGIYNENVFGQNSQITISNGAFVYAYGGGASNGASSGICTPGSITVDNASVFANGAQPSTSSQGMDIRGDIVVKGNSHVAACGIDYGMKADGDITCTGGVVDATGVEESGIQAEGDITVDACLVKATGGNIGIAVTGSITCTGGAVFALDRSEKQAIKAGSAEIYTGGGNILVYAGGSETDSVLLGEGDLPLTKEALDKYGYIKAGVKSTVSYDGNGGEGSMPEAVVVYGDGIPVPANGFTRTGYIFTGWNTQADGNGRQLPTDAYLVATGDQTLYAQWEVDETVSVTITTQPKNVTTKVGNIFQLLKVEATETPAGTGITYQWYRCDDANKTNAQAISGASHPTFIIPTDLAKGTYYYFCRVSAEEIATVDSNVAVVTVQGVPATGDTSHIGLWIALMMVSLAALAACIIVWRKKRTDEN